MQNVRASQSAPQGVPSQQGSPGYTKVLGAKSNKGFLKRKSTMEPWIRMLDMGFEPEIRQIMANCPGSATAQEVLAGEARQTLFFTATWPKEVQKSALLFTRQAIKIQVGGMSQESSGLATNTSIKQTVQVLEESEKIVSLRKVIASDLKPGETAIVFAGGVRFNQS